MKFYTYRVIIEPEEPKGRPAPLETNDLETKFLSN
jgi:hypothetical protein